jgi:hypothetical protein
MMTDEEQAPRARKAVGPDRQVYFGPADVDRVMAVVLALTSEVASLRDRIDTHERIAAAGGVANGAAVEAFEPDARAQDARQDWRDRYIRRLFRVFTEDAEALRRQ